MVPYHHVPPLLPAILPLLFTSCLFICRHISHPIVRLPPAQSLSFAAQSSSFRAPTPLLYIASSSLSPTSSLAPACCLSHLHQQLSSFTTECYLTNTKN